MSNVNRMGLGEGVGEEGEQYNCIENNLASPELSSGTAEI